MKCCLCRNWGLAWRSLDKHPSSWDLLHAHDWHLLEVRLRAHKETRWPSRDEERRSGMHATLESGTAWWSKTSQSWLSLSSHHGRIRQVVHQRHQLLLWTHLLEIRLLRSSGPLLIPPAVVINQIPESVEGWMIRSSLTDAGGSECQ